MDIRFSNFYLSLSSSFRRGFREMESLTIFVWNNKSMKRINFVPSLLEICWFIRAEKFWVGCFFYIYKWNLKNNLSRIFGIVELISWPTRGRVSISINQKIKRLFKSNKAGIPPSLVFNETLVAETIIRSYLH